MDPPPSPKQITLTQYSLKEMKSKKRRNNEEEEDDASREMGIESVRRAIESDSYLFQWNRKSRNARNMAKLQRKNEEKRARYESMSSHDGRNIT